jgi:hypothetical protein
MAVCRIYLTTFCARLRAEAESETDFTTFFGIMAPA